MTALFFGITSFDGFKFRLANELMSSTFSYMKLYDNLELATVCLHINIYNYPSCRCVYQLN